ncbi:hypothetical protein F53441_46 [Fusarium austroafricanum]|uniref:Uncharacterized protein n=1 Tax=Fusarium austroafricanum TaxID=2364996 RepID=A0A8H4KY44_9HYPO|nr:hypothetical protein F53441_46 [Fusarium austroafricanum]
MNFLTPKKADQQCEVDQTNQPATSERVVKDVSPLSPGAVPLLNNQTILSNQVAKVTEKVDELKVGPRSRRSSDTRSVFFYANKDENREAIHYFVCNDRFFSIFESFIRDTHLSTTDIYPGKQTVEYSKAFRDTAKNKLKETWDPVTLDDILARLLSLTDYQLLTVYTGLSKKYRVHNRRRKRTAARRALEASMQAPIREEDVVLDPRRESDFAPHTRRWPPM